MRINHNITALNTYRQLSTNTANTGKSIEKLSSGLRINRAGDDAAGLAISEKMRGQIRGLDQASRNAQDGISLIQTAEGALNETHSILQRMRELATQASNDTNTTNDREQIQKEINQLTSEINRIGNTTEFNSKSLLDGALNVKGAVTANIKGGAVTGNINILSSSTSAKAAGATLTSTNTEISGSGRPTVTGTRVYSNPSSANSGPNVAKTAASITSSTLTSSSQEISALGNATLTSSGVTYTDTSDNDSGPNVNKTGAVVTSGTISNASSVEISDFSGDVYTGNKAYTGSTGPDVTAGNNELQVTVNGVTSTITLDVKTYDDSGAGTTLNDFISDLNGKLSALNGDLSAELDGSGQIVIKAQTNGTDSLSSFSIGGGGALEHLLTTPASDTLALESKTANNTISLNVNGTSQNITLANGTYDLTDNTSKTNFLTDLNTKLNSAFGTNNVTASFDGSGKLVLTNSVRGTSSTITNIGGTASSTLALDSADTIQGQDNTELYVTYNGLQQKLTLAEVDYTSGNNDSADDFLADLQTQLDSAFGSSKVTASFDNGNIKFTTSDTSDTFTVDAGGAKQFIGNSFSTGHEGLGNDELTLTVRGNQQTINLNDTTYDFTNSTDTAALISDLNAKLDAAYSPGEVVASWDSANNKLVLTDSVTGTSSTITGISGTAAATLGLNGANDTQGTDNTELTLTFNGSQQTITLNQSDYSAGGNDSADDFKNDLQAKLDTAFGAGNIEVSFDATNKLVLMAKNASDTLTIDGGGAEELLKASQSDTYLTDSYGSGNNTLNLSVNGVQKSITLSNGTYDFTNGTDKTNFLNDLNSQLNSAFGLGNVVASFDSNNKLTFTNALEGSNSTITDITGTATNTIGLASISYAQGENSNNTGTLTIDGQQVNITLNAGTYTPGGLASDLQTQIRAAGGSLADAEVNFADGSFTITSGTSGQGGTISIGSDELAKALKLTTSEGATSTSGANAVDRGLRFQVGANAGQAISVGIQDMRSQALKISDDTTGTVTASDGKVASYVSTASVTNGTENSNEEFALDVSTYEKASAAISVIDDAINAVSSQRSSLGAYQNRLDHTINNLQTSSENLTAAESRVRDVDMAKEMMEQTKNSILAQAAQAMLAQANQQPQGVLQLLRG